MSQVQGPARESHQEQKEMGLEISLEARVQHMSQAHPGDRDRTGNKQQLPEALPALPVPAQPQGSPATHGQDPISDPQSHRLLPQQDWSSAPQSPALPSHGYPKPRPPLGQRDGGTGLDWRGHALPDHLGSRHCYWPQAHREPLSHPVPWQWGHRETTYLQTKV